MSLKTLKVIVKFKLRVISLVTYIKWALIVISRCYIKKLSSITKRPYQTRRLIWIKEDELLAYKLKVVDRIEKFNIKNCFITLKDHNNLVCRLINPSKMQMGKLVK